MYQNFTAEDLDDTNQLFVGRLPDKLIPSTEGFESLWNLHPEDFHEIMMHGKLVKTPRWQQAFGKDYHYTRSTNKALPTPDSLRPYLAWAQQHVDARLNGILLNWYDGSLGHYIGKHRDSTKNMVGGAPIVTVSLGEERVFRLRQYRGTAARDFMSAPGTVFIMPYDTNQTWTHEVPRHKRYQGRRISITLRAFR